MPSKSVDVAGESPALYLVSTPIGNLGDVTRRAVEVFERADGVVAEDTRRTRELLAHLGVKGKKLTCIDANSSAGAIRRVAERVRAGEHLAYATDAGTPGVSDPARALVHECFELGVPVRAVPGPSALTAAVAVSGLVEGPFSFVGFLPRRGGARRKRLQAIASAEDPQVLFESPKRIQATLKELSVLCPGRSAFIGRELTKLHEEAVLDSLDRLAQRESWRGEIVLVLGPKPAHEVGERDPRFEVAEAVLQVALEQGLSLASLTRRLAAVTGVSRSALYARALELGGRPGRGWAAEGLGAGDREPCLADAAPGTEKK